MRDKSLVALQVTAKVRKGFEDAFRAASLKNAKRSVAQESGVVRFDVLQQDEDEREFLLYEVFKTKKDVMRHKETKHYQVWRDTVEPMMETQRTYKSYLTLFPGPAKWEYPTAGKKKKRKRDPNMPKRPPNAYMLFAKDKRGDVKSANPSMSPTDILREMGRMWRGMGPDQKAPYEQDAASAHRAYEHALAEYKRTGGF